MEDEAEIYDGIRAHFPLSFGKQSVAPTSLESIHNATRRSGGPKSLSSDPSSGNADGMPSLSSSSQAWVDSVRSKKPNLELGGEGSSSDAPSGSQANVVVGPPRPPPGLSSDGVDDDDDEVMVGPPPPPPNAGISDDDDDGVMVGPPRPKNIDEEEQEDEVENRYRIPSSNEIVLKGHTKVSFYLPSIIFQGYSLPALLSLTSYPLWLVYVSELKARGLLQNCLSLMYSEENVSSRFLNSCLVVGYCFSEDSSVSINLTVREVVSELHDLYDYLDFV